MSGNAEAYFMQPLRKYVTSSSPRTTCSTIPCFTSPAGCVPIVSLLAPSPSGSVAISVVRFLSAAFEADVDVDAMLGCLLGGQSRLYKQQNKTIPRSDVNRM